MKRSFLAVCLGTLFFAACKEVPPDINFNATNYVDTTYTVAVPATNPHQVLAEEFTGESCSNCPQGHTILDNAVSAHPGLVNVISLYENDGSTVTIPPTGAVYNFTDSEALAIGNSTIYNSVPALPNGGIDRVPLAGATGNLISDANWPQAITNRLSVVDSLNMTVASSYSGSATLGGAVATVTVTLTYTKTVSSQQNISVAVVQDSIVDFQEFPFGIVIDTYMFNDVFVGMMSTVPFGDPALSSMTTIPAGQFLQRVYTYTLPATFSSGKGAIYPAHCRVVAFVNAPGTGNNFQVYQSVQTPLMGP